MKSLRTLFLLVATSLLALNTYAAGEDCSKPQAPAVPDGSSASESEMLEAQKAIKAYVKEGEKYMKCLKEAEASLGEDITEEQSKKLVSRYNKMVDEMKATSDQFNTSVRKYQKQGQ